MPYCPKCDIEFVDGITVCTDCGGELVESEEAYKASLAEEEEKEKRAKYEEIIAKEEEGISEGLSDVLPEDGDIQAFKPVHVYVNKAQKYDDLKSSAYAFLLVGSAILIFLVLSLTGVINLPMTGFSKMLFQGMLVLICIAAFTVTLLSFRAAKKIVPEIGAETSRTEDLVEWFTGRYTGSAVDQKLDIDADSASAEELSLKRFEIIQDILITSYDLPDQSYVDSLCEEIYSRLYEKD